jgi:L-gulonate 5-dehydrogenase
MRHASISANPLSTVRTQEPSVKQLVTAAPSRLELRDAPDPVPGPDEALIAIEAVGICGSDLHLYTGDHPYARFPIVQGHEFAGRVVGLPDGYAGAVQVGRLVAVEPLLMCGECLPCRRGRGNCCLRMRTYGAHIDGALTERLAVRASLLHDAEGLSPELAALVEPMSIGLHAVARGGVRADDAVLVLGGGPIGQAILLAATDRGARVMVVDRLASRLELAHELGAGSTALASRERAVEEAVADWTGGEWPTVVFEATGVPAVLEEAIRLVASSGTVVVVGLSSDSITVPMIEFTRKELSVVGTRNSRGEFSGAVDLVRRRANAVARLISHRFPLERGLDAFTVALTTPESTGKVIIDVGGAA